MLKIERLSINFGGLMALKDIDLKVETGELVGIIGPNGGGKSTTFNVISGIYAPTTGSISLKGESLVGLAPHEIAARGVSRTFQNIRLFAELSVLENVEVASHRLRAYGIFDAVFRTKRFRERGRAIAEEASELLALLGLSHRHTDMAVSLPYGEQRRLEIARALATKPRLLLLDEPAAGMNPAEIAELMQLVRKIRQQFGLTIILIEHHMQLVMGICERVAVLDFGEKIAEGSPAEIQRNPRVLTAYLGQAVGNQ